MQPLIFTAIALAAASVADDTAKAPAPIPIDGKAGCQNPEVHKVRPAQPGASRKLGEEPPAKSLYAVLNSVEGCIKPIYVNEELPE